MTSTRIAVTGVLGRMGRLVTALAEEAGCVVVAALERDEHPQLGQSLAALGVLEPDAAGAEVPLGALSQGFAEQGVDVCIDFTLPAAFTTVLAACRQAGCSLVSGTTGLDASQEALLDEAAGEIPVLHATNFSLGVALLAQLSRLAAVALDEGYEIEIVEAHHGRKVDAPSGTAKTLAQTVAEARDQHLDKVARHGREGQLGTRSREEIGVHAVRGGSVVGEHTVHFLGPDERLELTHRAASREIFVRGALRCARWMAGKPPRRYTVAEVIAPNQPG